MSAEGRIARDVADAQVAMFAMFVGPGLVVTRAALSAASGIPESTLKGYAAGAAMPLHTVLTLRRFLPAAAINMLTEVGGARFGDVETADSNWDEAAAEAASLVAEVCDARRDGQIDHVEDARLKSRARHLIAELSEIAGP